MTKKSISLVALAAFIFGYATNEYRHQTGAISATPATLSNTINNEPPKQINKTPETVTPQVTQIPTDVFSWQDVNKLLVEGRNNEAIRLLRLHLEEHVTSVEAWFVLAQTYEKQHDFESALDAWFRYLDLELDVSKREQAIAHIKNYLTRLYTQASFNADNSPWLITQLDALVALSDSNSELHLMLASLYADLNDNYQAQYHALMAANDPKVQARAEDILAQLDGTALPNDLTIPLISYGNQHLVRATIEGYPARLLLDTGASLSGVSRNYTNQYPSIVKATKPIVLNTASGSENSFLFTVDNLSLGELQFNQHILALLPMHNMTDFDGLLGVDILARYDFVIDRDAKVLRLHKRKK